MDITTQRTQAYKLIDALPQDCLELVLSLMRKLMNTVQPEADNATNDEQHANHVALLSHYKEIGGRIWNEDPQEYVSALRSEERVRCGIQKTRVENNAPLSW